MTQIVFTAAQLSSERLRSFKKAFQVSLWIMASSTSSFAAELFSCQPDYYHIVSGPAFGQSRHNKSAPSKLNCSGGGCTIFTAEKDKMIKTGTTYTKTEEGKNSVGWPQTTTMVINRTTAKFSVIIHNQSPDTADHWSQRRWYGECTLENVKTKF